MYLRNLIRPTFVFMAMIRILQLPVVALGFSIVLALLSLIHLKEILYSLDKPSHWTVLLASAISAVAILTSYFDLSVGLILLFYGISIHFIHRASHWTAGDIKRAMMIAIWLMICSFVFYVAIRSFFLRPEMFTELY